MTRRHASYQGLYDGHGAFSLDVGDPARHDDDAVSYDDAETSDLDETPACQLVGRYDRHGGSGTLVISDVARNDVSGSVAASPSIQRTTSAAPT